MVASGFAVLSYGELGDQIEQARARLRRAGLDRNARIAVALPTGAEAALAIVAVASAAAAVPLDPKLTFVEVERCLRILRPDAVVLLRDDHSAARNVAARHRMPMIEAIFAREGRLGMRLTVPQIGPAALLDDPEPDAPAFIVNIANALHNLRDLGIVPVVAAGNGAPGNPGDKTALSAPACVSKVLSVGASDKNDVPAAFSNASPGLDLWAPGTGFVPTTAETPCNSGEEYCLEVAAIGGTYGRLEGTSIAAPRVSSVIHP